MDNFVSNLLCHFRQHRTDINSKEFVEFLEAIEQHGLENDLNQKKFLEKILQIFLNWNVNTACDGDLFSNIIYLTNLQQQKKLRCFSNSQFTILFEWILLQHQSIKNEDAVCKVIVSIGNLLVLHSEDSNKYVALMLRMISKYLSSNVAEDVFITALKCLNKILEILPGANRSEEQLAACAYAGHKLLYLHYFDTPSLTNNSNILITILCTFQILQKTVLLVPKFAYQQTDELLGLSRIYFVFGVDANQILVLKPQRVYKSPQYLCNSAEGIEYAVNSENSQSFGGKTIKTRKPRVLVKNTRSSKSHQEEDRSAQDKCSLFLLGAKASDSEYSDSESASNKILHERSIKAKIRLAAINLVGSIVRILDRKIVFGYWHVLLPSGIGESADNLLYISQHDPNLRCRSTSLQVCTQLLYGSKGYLCQAELNIKRCPTTFTPFSVSLGYTVMAVYKDLTKILSSESSLPVLTQALKCFAVLVQASTFKQFKNGLDFVEAVKPFVYHRDVAIQVSALMVMEFLVALPVPKCAIAEAIGVPNYAAQETEAKLQNVNKKKLNIDEILASEEGIRIDENIDGILRKCFNTQGADESFWLLNRVLHNLCKHDRPISTSVRIESLNVLIVLTSEFSSIKLHLTKISEILLQNLKDILLDIRLHAARCVDACAYQISCYLLDNVLCSNSEIRECNNFWVNMMPFLMNRIRRDSEEITTVRIILCDSLSNIGAHIFEHTSHSSQISLLSLLSGVASDSLEDTLVRAASARALAVFSLYPHLRSDLVFIENTAELTLGLVTDSNLLVRIKSFWSLGNISDAFIFKQNEVEQFRPERVSDDLLFRLINAATTACSDNDKVRCNAVRSVGNFLRLLSAYHFNTKNTIFDWRNVFMQSISKLNYCIHSSGNAKVKWNTCYAISNIMQNPSIFKLSDVSWRETIYPGLCKLIVHHPNYKVRINASSAITNIAKRTYFGIYYETFWSSVLEAIEESYNLDNFYEYNHRDNLQEQLCLALSHMIKLAIIDDLHVLKKHVFPRAEIIRITWQRVTYRIVPEKVAPLLCCSKFLVKCGIDQTILSLEQKSILNFLIEIFNAE